ncbi:Zinc finger protein [Fasciola hepatica]|uniref:Zinc finger protein n=1 Tax=Fasciola hepatica TaxID=6192 RepID=A0A4E0S0W5_FASHE|nr:Zinc finger protein [Fasciola hepatica]
MVLQSTLSTKPLLISVSSPSITTSSEAAPAHWLQNNNNNSTSSVLSFISNSNNNTMNNNSTSCLDMNMLANFYQPKTEPNMATALAPTASSTQLLYRAMLQQFGGVPSDPASLPYLLSAFCKRFAPDCRSSITNSTEPVPPTVNNTAGTPNFAMTAAITSALSSNSSIVGSQVLPACSPLLQLAVRQALSQCLPHFSQLNIQGHLEISGGSTQAVQSATVLKFNDVNGIQSPTSPVVSMAEKPIMNGFSASELSIPCTSPVATSNLASTTTTNSIAYTAGNELSHDTSQSSQFGASSSRRKSTNPIKCTLPENAPGSGLNLSPTSGVSNGGNNNSTSPLIPPGRSSPNSPSTDSGVLDLSRNGSLAGSAPITPLKDLSLTHNASVEPTEQMGRIQLLESYQKQLAAFSQYHSVWNKTMLFGALDPRVNGEVTAPVHSSGQSSSLFHPASNGALSAPNSPIKSIRRQRMNTGCNLVAGGATGNGTSSAHRLSNSVRRPSSNRRFPCNQCREEFPSLHTLEEHTMCQHGTYRCHICKAQFTQRSNLQRHALKHVGFKPFECRVCSKAYYRKDHLMRHMEMGHPGYTPRENITVHLTSSESLDYLNRSITQHGLGLSSESEPAGAAGQTTLHSSPREIADHGIGMEVDDEVDRIDAEDEPDVVGEQIYRSNVSHEASRHRFDSTGSPHESGSFGEVALDAEDEELEEAGAHPPSRSSVNSEIVPDEDRSSDTAIAHMSPETSTVATQPNSSTLSQFDCGRLLVPPTFKPYACGPHDNRKMSV